MTVNDVHALACMKYVFPVSSSTPPSTELVDYSLAQRANPGVENPDQLLFFVHDIILDYLKDSVPQEKQVREPTNLSD